jgi:RNA polymerase sigma-70 factor, ECF subfamily
LSHHGADDWGRWFCCAARGDRLGRVAADLADAVGRAQQGDAEAFRLLHRDIQPRLLRYPNALAVQDAEDIASETWLQVTRDLPGLHRHLRRFRGSVATIARHRALDHLRRTTRRPPALPLPAEDLAARPAAADTAQTGIDAAATRNAVALIATLPPDQAEAVLLRASSASTPLPQDTSSADAALEALDLVALVGQEGGDEVVAELPVRLQRVQRVAEPHRQDLRPIRVVPVPLELVPRPAGGWR